MNASARQRPGTLLWIGPRDHPEVRDAYRSCETLVPQLAYRASIDEACDRPAQVVSHVVLARLERTPLPGDRWERLRQVYPYARFASLLSHACEGEMRTGEPWPGWKRIYWHRWFQDLPDWLGLQPSLGPPAEDGAARSLSTFVVIVAANLEQAEPLLELARQQRWPASWLTPGKPGVVRWASHVLWDDSAAGPAGRHVWRQRLAPWGGDASAAPRPFRLRHAWLTGFPRRQCWREAEAAGVDCLFSKPAALSALIRFVACASV